MVREFQETEIDTVSIDSGNPSNHIISFASARDDFNNFQIDDNGNPIWQYTIFYCRGEHLGLNPNTLYRYKEDWVTGEQSPLEAMTTDDDDDDDAFVTGLEFWFSDNNLLNIKVKVVLNPEVDNPSEEEFITAVTIRN
jgi:hypothetical protein